MYLGSVFWPGLVVMTVGAALALMRGRIAPAHAGKIATLGLALACAGALMTVAL